MKRLQRNRPKRAFVVSATAVKQVREMARNYSPAQISRRLNVDIRDIQRLLAT